MSTYAGIVAEQRAERERKLAEDRKRCTLFALEAIAGDGFPRVSGYTVDALAARGLIEKVPGDNLAECLRVTKPGGILAMFTDWRQLPATTDAVQAGGWVWRGILPWIKPDARPQKGRFSAAAEYVVWATNGPREINFRSDDPTPAGYYLCIAPRDREHITQKPLEVMLHLTALVEPGGLVLDPFMGAGTTGVAAVMRGARFIGADHHAHNVEISERRIRTATLTAAPAGDQTAIDFGAMS